MDVLSPFHVMIECTYIPCSSAERDRRLFWNFETVHVVHSRIANVYLVYNPGEPKESTNVIWKSPSNSHHLLKSQPSILEEEEGLKGQ